MWYWSDTLYQHFILVLLEICSKTRDKQPCIDLCTLDVKLAQEKGLNSIQILRGSKIVIKWAKQHICMENTGIIPRMNQILEVIDYLNDISFTCVYHEFKIQTNKLSKDASILKDGTIINLHLQVLHAF